MINADPGTIVDIEANGRTNYETGCSAMSHLKALNTYHSKNVLVHIQWFPFLLHKCGSTPMPENRIDRVYSTIQVASFPLDQDSYRCRYHDAQVCEM